MDKNQRFQVINSFANKFTARSIIAVLITVAAITAYFLPFFVVIPEPNKEHVAQGQGFLWGAAVGVFTWFFGSAKNKEDADKAENIKEMIKQAKE